MKEMQSKLNIKATTLMSISDTRWVCRIQNCDAVFDNFEVIINVLNDEVYLNNDMDVAQAIGLLLITFLIKYLLKYENVILI